MRLIRTFEDTVQQQFQKGNVHSTTHLYSGQEASGVGVCSMLRDGDKVAGTYRGHGHSIALGVEPQKLMDEMFGRTTGACGGRAQAVAARMGVAAEIATGRKPWPGAIARPRHGRSTS
jgi:TPP-dependent pyruvate/acetoin dehydrogenase alpha subunit